MPGRAYSAAVSGSAGTTKTFGTLGSIATTRGWVYDLLVGSDATPADLAGNFQLARFTASGTGTSVTPLALDGANPAALMVASGTHTVEPTYAAAAAPALLMFGLNQRATFRWVAAPGGEIVVPAVAAAVSGVGIRTLTHGGTPTIMATIHWME